MVVVALWFQSAFGGVSSIAEQLEQDAKEVFYTTFDISHFGEYLTSYRKRYGPRKLESAYRRLSTYENNHESPIIRHQLHQLIKHIEANYEVSDTPEPVRTIINNTSSINTIVQEPTVQNKPETLQEVVEKIEVKIEELPQQEPELEQEELPQDLYRQVPTTDINNTEVEVIEKGIPMTNKRDEYYQLAEGTINITTLQNTRLWRVNEVRVGRGLDAMNFHPALHRTASEWSSTMKKKWVADHKRNSSSSYYNYWELVNRFEDRGVIFANRSRSTFTENVWYARTICNQSDCTQEAITSLRAIFDYFISEEWKEYDTHRRTIIHPRFEIVGVGISVDEAQWRIYTTQHYGTAVE